jgi:protein-S-isoprenylcysteine O-methyltransferase Ste14
MNNEEHGNAFEYSRADDIILGVIVLVMIVSSILSQAFGWLRLPLKAGTGRLIGGLLFLIGAGILAHWASLWGKEYKGQLITHSIYQYLRHPHYLSVILLFNGLSLFFRSIISLVLAIYVTIAIVRGIKEEEEHLAKQYGPAYEAYMRKTKWKFIPFIY